MPPNGFLSDEQVAQVLTYLRQNFGNHDAGRPRRRRRGGRARPVDAAADADAAGPVSRPAGTRPPHRAVNGPGSSRTAARTCLPSGLLARLDAVVLFLAWIGNRPVHRRQRPAAADRAVRSRAPVRFNWPETTWSGVERLRYSGAGRNASLLFALEQLGRQHDADGCGGAPMGRQRHLDGSQLASYQASATLPFGVGAWARFGATTVGAAGRGHQPRLLAEAFAGSSGSPVRQRPDGTIVGVRRRLRRHPAARPSPDHVPLASASQPPTATQVRRVTSHHWWCSSAGEADLIDRPPTSDRLPATASRLADTRR